MRTDPRAAEVRAIVKRVFACFLEENEDLRDSQEFEATDETPLVPSGRIKHGWGNRRQFGGSSRTSRYPCSSGVPSVANNRGPEIDETILIDQGRYVARSYRAGGWLAMWLVGVGIVQFYDHCGRMLGTVNLFESLRPERMAA